jgi:outer membrane protein TolC
MPPRFVQLICGLSAFAGLAGCATSEGLQRDTARNLGAAARGPGGAGREAHQDALAQRAPAPADEVGLVLTPESSLELAYRHSRTLQTEREKLQTSTLNLLASRRRLGLTSTLTGGVRKLLEGDSSSAASGGAQSSSVTLGLGETLRTGGVLSLSGTETIDLDPVSEASREFRTVANAKLRQPLLKGAGYETSHAALIAAERQLVYDLRAFELARQELALTTLRGLYDLVQLDNVVLNTGKTVEQASYLRRRSDAMFKVQLAPYLDVLRSEQQELSARARLDETRTGYTNGVRRFVADLGLPSDRPVRLDTPLPPLRPLRADESLCRQAALENRLDLHTARGRLEDAERGLRIARQGRLPDLAATAAAGWRTERDEGFPGSNGESSAEVGVEFTLPLDGRADRDAVRAAELALAQARRALEALEEDIAVGVARSFARLHTAERRVEIERRNLDIAGRRVENAIIRFKAGELSNRDVVEAEDELLLARNTLAQSLITHELERLGLLKDLGLLEVNAAGALRELSRDAEGSSLFGEPTTPPELTPDAG